MEKSMKPNVKLLAQGTEFTAKRMRGKETYFLPKHAADVESIIFINEGECILFMDTEEIHLKPGDAYIIPPNVKHQFKGITDFAGIHFMPKNINFKFYT